jgi:hypothetical protein
MSGTTMEVTLGGVVVELGVPGAHAATAITMPPAAKAALIRTSSMLAGKKRGEAHHAKLRG